MKKYNNMAANELLDFIKRSPSCYHVINNLKTDMLKNGFSELKEQESWEIKPGGRYFVSRNNSSIISFIVPKQNIKGFRIMASHSDSPVFKLKVNPEIKDKYYTRLNIEKYGAMLLTSWMDRPLSTAGRIFVKNNGSIKEMPVNIDRDLMLIPSLAVHMYTNKDCKEPNVQTDMLPVIGTGNKELMTLIAEESGVNVNDIIGSDLFLYSRCNPSIWGVDNEFISSQKLDDIQCCYGTFKGFIEAEPEDFMAVHAVFDNEEVGSCTKQGADSTFLRDTLKRIYTSLKLGKEDLYKALANSFMISADNAHGIHPNNPEKADPVNRPEINKGIVIKYSANQKYTTDGISEAVVKLICSENNIPYQEYTNRSDIAGGSTLGNISSSQVSVDSADIGLPQLSMHSAYETAGVKDLDYLIQFTKSFYKTIEIKRN